MVSSELNPFSSISKGASGLTETESAVMRRVLYEYN